MGSTAKKNQEGARGVWYRAWWEARVTAMQTGYYPVTPAGGMLACRPLRSSAISIPADNEPYLVTRRDPDEDHP